MQTIYVWNKKYRNLQTTFKGMEKSVDRESERKIPGMSHGSKNWSRSYKEQGIDLIRRSMKGMKSGQWRKRELKQWLGNWTELSGSSTRCLFLWKNPFSGWRQRMRKWKPNWIAGSLQFGQAYRRDQNQSQRMQTTQILVIPGGKVGSGTFGRI